MRSLAAFGLFTCLCLASSGAMADDFGTRFWSKAPSGLGDYVAPETRPVDLLASSDDAIAASLQEITPAAGSEAPAEEQTVDTAKK